MELYQFNNLDEFFIYSQTRTQMRFNFKNKPDIRVHRADKGTLKNIIIGNNPNSNAKYKNPLNYEKAIKEFSFRILVNKMRIPNVKLI